MSDDPDFDVDGWQVLTDERDPLRVTVASADETVLIMIGDYDGEGGGYTASVEQHIQCEGYETAIQTQTIVSESLHEFVDEVRTFMSEVNDGRHILHPIGVEQWKEFYQFYCISDSEVPDEMEAEELVELIQNESEQDDHDPDIDAIDDIDPTAENVLTVDVFPRHQTEVQEIDES